MTDTGAARERFADAPASGAVARVLVLADVEKPGVSEVLDEMDAWLGQRVDEVAVERDVREWCQRRGAGSDRRAAPDLAVVLGGDGAMLGVVRAFADEPVPTLGINFGRIGFLASVPGSRWQEALEGILAGRGEVEPRMRIEARQTPGDGKRAVALNEVAVQRGAHQGMLTVRLYVGDAWVTDYRADGLIVATPTGSTAHSLSAGGPILAPATAGLVVTPMCPQGLSNRPIVLPPDSRIRIEIVESAGITTLVVDGQGFVPMRRGHAVQIARCKKPYPLLTWTELDPYRRLRERLGWSGRIAPEVPSPAPEPGADIGHGGVL